MNKIIFRVEGYDGIGPYNSRKNIEKYIPDMLEEHSTDLKNFPCARDDFDFYNRAYKCAVPNACVLFHWFGKYLNEVKKHYNIYTIRIKTYKKSKSGYQVLYDPSRVKRKIKLYDK
jgi:hypothetical protein